MMEKTKWSRAIIVTILFKKNRPMMKSFSKDLYRILRILQKRKLDWGWKTMLKVKDEIKEHVWFEIGNGRKTSVWYDKWCKDGPLSNVISKRDIYEARLQDEARVADIINNGQWMWPDGWMNRYPILATLNRNINPTDSEDNVT
ncbi:hypothetical protein Tco_0951271 [Tanacetum coccineum]|uniref:RNA-directed DNA polymerase, eukaryota, Reverse transcriptase zinc-binding domain protein n=1 Tax=Tanacetum coccineum TaxID=301880 RepID=A0ABQ5DWF9_9ASTR